MATEKQIKANQVNALKWWVKTQEGKEIVSKNALKHWLTSLMIASQEEKELYESIVNVLVEELKPESLLETMIFERIALYYMKLQRVTRLDTKQVEIDRLQEEIDYLESTKPQRESLLLDLDFESKNDKAKEKEILEIENKIHMIQSRIWDISKGYIGQSSIEFLEKFHRYETALENRLYKGIKEYYKIKAINSWKPMIDVSIES